MSARKGQAWTIDFTAAITALSFIIMLYILVWNLIALRWSLIADHTGMEAAAFFAAESLMASPGEPESWEMLPHIDGNVSALGLATGRNELSRVKIEKLVSENATGYATAKARLGLQRFDFGMRVSDISGNTVLYEFGRFAPPAQGNSLAFDRLGILDGEPVIVHMEVWG